MQVLLVIIVILLAIIVLGPAVVGALGAFGGVIFVLIFALGALLVLARVIARLSGAATASQMTPGTRIRVTKTRSDGPLYQLSTSRKDYTPHPELEVGQEFDILSVQKTDMPEFIIYNFEVRDSHGKQASIQCCGGGDLRFFEVVK